MKPNTFLFLRSMNEKFAWSDLYGISCLDWFDLSQMPKAHVSSYIVRALICICILYLLIAFSQMLTMTILNYSYYWLTLFIWIFEKLRSWQNSSKEQHLFLSGWFYLKYSFLSKDRLYKFLMRKQTIFYFLVHKMEKIFKIPNPFERKFPRIWPREYVESRLLVYLRF